MFSKNKNSYIEDFLSEFFVIFSISLSDIFIQTSGRVPKSSKSPMAARRKIKIKLEKDKIRKKKTKLVLQFKKLYFFVFNNLTYGTVTLFYIVTKIS